MSNFPSQILLIHGLSRTPLSLIHLKWGLDRRCCRADLFGYAAMLESYDAIARRLHDRLQVMAKRGSYGIVTHSLGGVLLRSALSLAPIVQPVQIVMIGPPNQRPRLAPIAWKFPPFRWWTGTCGENLSLATFYQNLPRLNAPYTIIAGTSGFNGRWSPFGMDVNDSIVALSEARLSESDRIIELPVRHTLMMYDRWVKQEIFQALKLSGGGAEPKPL
jgi:Alpha/beta hydrolase family